MPRISDMIGVTDHNDRLPQLLMLNVGHVVHNGDWNFSDVSSPFTRIYYVTGGEAQIMQGSSLHSLTPGNMYIVPPFVKHTNICSGFFSHYYIHIYEDNTDGSGLIDNLDFPFSISGTQHDRVLFETICDNNESMRLKCSDPRIYDNKTSLIECVRLNRERPLYDRMESAGIIYQLLSRFVKAAKPRYASADKRIVQALRYIGENMYGNVTLEDIAHEAYMSRDHFIKVFNREVGCSPIQYIIRQKMMKAQLMLASSDSPIKDIALFLGYDDFSYFSQLFKRHVGKTPLQYRNSFNHNR